MSRLLTEALQQSSNTLTLEQIESSASMESEYAVDLLARKEATNKLNAINTYLAAADNDLSTEAEAQYHQMLAQQLDISEEDISLEKIKGFKNRLIQSIKNLDSRIRGGLGQMLNSEVRTASGLIGFAQEIERELRNYSDEDRVKDEIKVVGGRYMHYDGEIDPHTVSSHAQEAAHLFANVSEKTLAYGNKYIQAGIDSLEVYLQRSKTGAEFTGKDLEKLHAPYKDYVAFADELSKFAGKQLPGGWRVGLEVDNTRRAKNRIDGKTMGTVFLVHKDQTGLGSYKNEDKVPAPTKEQMEKLLTAAREILDTFTSSERMFKDVLERLDRIDALKQNVLQMVETKEIEVFDGHDSEGNTYTHHEKVIVDITDPHSFIVDYLEPIVTYFTWQGVKSARSYLLMVKAGLENKK